MPTKIGSTQIKKIVYGGVNVKKAYCNGVQVFSSDHTVTYKLKSTSWTATVEDGANAAAVTSVNTTASGKMGSGDTFLGWTTGTGTTPSSTITCDADNMTLYGIWKHAHVGSNTVKSGCYQGAASEINYVRNTGNNNWSDACGCSHTLHSWHCDKCGRDWTSQTNRSDGCTQGHSVSDNGNGNCCSDTVYALSCGKTAGTFRG